MTRMPRVLLFAVLCLLPSLACAQVGASADDDAPAPAPGEPGAASAESGAPSGEDSGTPDPIANTELGEATDEVPAAESTDDLETQLAETRQELAALKAELEKLRGEYVELFAAVTEHATAINNHAEGLQGHTDSLKAQDEQLVETLDRLKAIETGQQTLGQQLQAIASSEGVDHEALKVLGNMQASAGPPQNARFRLRIHNTTGAEQLLTVNGVAWTVRADEWTYVPIPLGPVTVHRPGQEPLEIAEEKLAWHSDKRGYFVNYDLENHQVEEPADAAEASTES